MPRRIQGRIVNRDHGFVLCLCLVLLFCVPTSGRVQGGAMLGWESLPELPDSLGLGGPLVGVHNDALIVAGGANFPKPVWDNDKVWRDEAWVLIKGESGNYEWIGGFRLDRPIAYASCVSTPYGVACLGGTDGQTTFDRCFLLQWDPQSRQLSQEPLPSLPAPCLLYTSPSPRDRTRSRMPSSA